MLQPMKKMQLLFVSLCLLISSPLIAMEIQTSIDRNPVSLNESFQIIFSANQTPDADPDLTPLQDNFDIVNQQHNSNASWVNGHASRTEQWIVNVMAKQPGELLIPPIAFGSDRSKPLKITVTETQSSPQSNDDLFMEVSATPEKPYIQSQVIYSLRIFRRVQITQAKLDEPQPKNAVVEKLGEDSSYVTQIRGVNYSVMERKYAIFPQQSGVLTIAPLTLTADVVVSRRSHLNSFFGSQSTETHKITSKAIELNVQAEPANYKANNDWLTAESVELTEEWSDNSMQVRVGEPLTRTIRMVAKAATVSSLPELAGKTDIEGIKTYPDQPLLKEDKDSDGLQASREEKIAFIPSKPGEYKLPAVEVTWFNTKTQSMQKAHLPAATIKALAIAQTDMPQNTSSFNSSVDSTQPATTAVSMPTDRVVFWQGLSAFLGLGWLITLILGYLRYQKLMAIAQSNGLAQPESAIEKQLKKACQESNPQLAKQQLILWGQLHFGIDNLAGICQHVPLPLQHEINILSKHLYSSQTSIWNGDKLWQTFSSTKIKHDAKQNSNDELEPLYKL